MDLAAHVETWFHRRGQLNTAGIVAVSGGPDSVALAHLLVGLLQAGKLERLILAHVNHQLRGDESDADELFVQELPVLFRMADESRLHCRSTRIPVAEIAEVERENLESIARRERYAWLKRLAQEESAAWIATGHSADDQAETVLLRIIRGSGVLGLASIRECRPLDEKVRLVRPLLSARRQAVHDWLHINHIPYRLDSSNQDPRFARNRIRLHLLPLLQDNYNPGIVAALCRLAEQGSEMHGTTEAQARQLLSEAELPRGGDILVFATDRMRTATANLVREMFRLVWQREAWPMGEMDFDHWNRLAEVAAGSRSAWDFPGGVQARRVGKVIQLRAERRPVS